MDIAAMITRLGGITRAVTRSSGGSYPQTGATRGQYVPGSTSTVNILMSVQPLSAREQVLYIAGDRTKQFFKVYSVAELYTIDTTTGRQADKITYLGKTFEVIAVEPWDAAAGTYYKAVISWGEQS